MTEAFKLDFVGIGSARCATSWISQCLAEHPQICFPRKMKELHFFNKRHWMYSDVENRNYENKGMAWLESLFSDARPGQKLGEYSAVYLTCPTARERIRHHFPDAKIIVSVRNPIKRVYSEYVLLLRWGIYSRRMTLEDAIEKFPYPILERGMYAKYLRGYLEDFSDVKIIFVDDVGTDPKAVLSDLFAFIGVDPGFEPPSLHDKGVNVQQVARFPVLNNVLGKANYYVRKYNLNGLLKFLNKTQIERLLLEMIKKNARVAEMEPMKPETIEHLKNVYRDDIHELEKMTGRDLSGWLAPG